MSDQTETTLPDEIPVIEADRERAMKAVAAFCGYEPGRRWDALIHNVTVAIAITRWEERARCENEK